MFHVTRFRCHLVLLGESFEQLIDYCPMVEMFR